MFDLWGGVQNICRIEQPHAAAQEKEGGGIDDDEEEKPARIDDGQRAAKYLKMRESDLITAVEEGQLIAYRTPGGSRRYSKRLLQRFLDRREVQ